MKLNFLNYHIFPKIYAKIFKICFQEIFNVTINIYISFLIHLIKTFFNLWQSLNVIIVIYKIHLIISTRVTYSCSEISRRKIKRNATCLTS